MRKSVIAAWMLLTLAGLVPVAFAQTPEPRTFCRFVPERSDDFAWENDLVAFRVYGPALRSGAEDSGIDCWLKRVKYPIIDKWYREALEDEKSYHKDHGEGYDPYHVGSSAGCGGTALWFDGKRVSLETFTKYEVVECKPEQSKFKLTYEREIDGVLYGEERTISIELGKRLFEVRSVFTKDGKIAAELPVCIGVATHDGKATVHSDSAKGWIACWETIKESGLGTAAMMDPQRIKEIKEVKGAEKDAGHVFLITNTDNEGAVSFKAGYGWETAGEIKTSQDWLQYLNQQCE